MTEKTSPDLDQEKVRREQELRIHRQIAFASGLFQGDVTIRTLLESLAEGIVIIDNSGTILLVNTAAEKMFGYPKKDLIGKPHAVLIPERFRKVHEEHEAGFFAEPRIRPMGQLLDLAGCRRDGSEFPVEISLGFIETINGVLVLAMVSDMTLRKQFEMRLRESEELFHIQVECVQDYAIYMLDAQGNVLNWNAGAERLKGYRGEEIVGKHFSCFYTEEERIAGKPEEMLKRAEKEGRVTDEGWRVRKDGSRFWADVIITALRGENGNLRGFSNVTRDITERKRADQEREQLLIQLDAVLNSINEGVIISDLEGNVLSMNPSALALHEYESVEQVRRQLHQYQETFELSDLDGGPVPFEQWPLSRALRGERFIDYEVRVRRKDTGKLWIGSYSGTPVQTKSGDIILSVVTLRDITERKQAEEALRKSEKKFSKVFHSVPALIGITTVAEGRCIDINEAGLRTLGYLREEMVGRTMLELGVWESTSARDRVIRILEEDGMVRDLEINFRGKNGKTFTGLFSAEPVDFNGDRYMLSIVNDITERKRMEEEIERLNTDLAARAAELEGANKELEAFNYTVAHDLRKPLTVVNGYCQAIRELCGDKLDEQCKGYLREAYDGTLRMNRLIDALLNFSRLAHIEPRRETVGLSALAHEVAAELQLAEPGRRVTFLIADGVSADGDAALLRVVLDNFLGNAWKYTGTREEGIIEFGTTEVDGKPAWFVRDNGPGFDMAYAEKLFLPFQRLPGADKFRGHGIGLATAERIIRRHGGRVWAEGEPGKGATFWFTLPTNGR